jgi:hypothetical protein
VGGGHSTGVFGDPQRPGQEQENEEGERASGRGGEGSNEVCFNRRKV